MQPLFYLLATLCVMFPVPAATLWGLLIFCRWWRRRLRY
jgi:hypothetical protein